MDHTGSQPGSVSQSCLLDSSNGLGQPWTRDLELMHHYCTVTSDTLAHHEGARHVWKTVFPQEGYVHEYVMHGVLSLAALHKATLIPCRRKNYLTRSAYHHTIGQESFRILLPTVESTNWRPIFCFATIVIAYVLCQPARSDDGSAATTPISKTLELVSVTKGIKAVLLPFIPQLNHTNLAPLVNSVWLVSLDCPPDLYVVFQQAKTLQKLIYAVNPLSSIPLFQTTCFKHFLVFVASLKMRYSIIQLTTITLSLYSMSRPRRLRSPMLISKLVPSYFGHSLFLTVLWPVSKIEDLTPW